ncbi:MAG: pyridoxamine 5'-phosphate oxidase family protein [Chitinophagaceae bacterium]|nr:MAG: pyridoxamine 5'-phosphate oxidase family protein [Chitinophagaceae bacterium]
MFGTLNPGEIDDLLHQQFVGRIGCHADGLTYVVPVSYAYDGKCIYIHSLKGLKLEIMRKNPVVCFEVDETKRLSDWRSVIAFGHFEELEQEDDVSQALKILHQRELPLLASQTMQLTSQWPFPAVKDDGIEGIFCRITITAKSGRFEKSDDTFYYST